MVHLNLIRKICNSIKNKLEFCDGQRKSAVLTYSTRHLLCLNTKQVQGTVTWSKCCIYSRSWRRNQNLHYIWIPPCQGWITPCSGPNRKTSRHITAMRKKRCHIVCHNQEEWQSWPQTLWNHLMGKKKWRKDLIRGTYYSWTDNQLNGWSNDRKQSKQVISHQNLSQWNTALRISSIYGSSYACLVYRLPRRDHQHMFGVIMGVWWRINLTWILSSTRSTRQLHSTSNDGTWQLGYALSHGSQQVRTLQIQWRSDYQRWQENICSVIGHMNQIMIIARLWFEGTKLKRSWSDSYAGWVKSELIGMCNWCRRAMGFCWLWIGDDGDLITAYNILITFFSITF